MRRFLPLLLCAFFGVARAQQQEQKLMDRLNSKPDMSQVNPMQNQAYGSGKFRTKDFQSGAYNGIKNAEVQSFQTRSFFGLKNPWFGRKVFATGDSSLTSRTAKEAREQFKTDAFAVRQFDKGDKPDVRDTTAALPVAAQPRPYLATGKRQGSLDMERFTENLQKDLTIDDVRDLLNKGTSK